MIRPFIIFAFIIGSLRAEELQMPTDIEAPVLQQDSEDGSPELEVDRQSECEQPALEIQAGVAAAQSAEESTISNKTWRRFALISAGVVVAALAIYSVNQNQGKEVYK
jgi:hypothetical protein